jgi:succinate-semialdehyde dehydrogenase/glutarate-semialdehyde dehydrogenase
MTNERQLEIVEEHIKDAVARGARVLVGGNRLNQGIGLYHEPTVITGVNQSMKLMCEETFGPVLPIMTFKSDEEAVKLANDSVYGLTASIWTNNISRGFQLAKRIEAGTVMVNEVVYTHAVAQTPWGGVKQSGYGRTHGRLGLLELVTPQHVHVNRLPWLPDAWWFGYSKQASKLFHSFARRFTTGSLFQLSLLIPALVKRFFERR